MSEKPAFRQWFDIDNAEHRAAYIYLREHGVWPAHFHPSDHCGMEPLWTITAAEQYIGWLEYQLEIRL